MFASGHTLQCAMHACNGDVLSWGVSPTHDLLRQVHEASVVGDGGQACRDSAASVVSRLHYRARGARHVVPLAGPRFDSLDRRPARVKQLSVSTAAVAPSAPLMHARQGVHRVRLRWNVYNGAATNHVFALTRCPRLHSPSSRAIALLKYLIIQRSHQLSW
jgi:hypothetical protein